MTIFIVSANLFKGGAEHVGIMLANGFVMRENNVYLLSDLNLPIAYQINKNVKTVGIFPNTSNKIAKWWGAMRRIRRNVRKEKPDVIIGVAETCSLISKIASFGTGIPIIYTAHNSFERPQITPLGKWDKFAKFQLGRAYNRITVLTEADRVFIRNRLKKISVMPNPLGLIPVDSICQKRNVILAVGRLDSWHCKGFDVLIKVWGKLVDSLQFTVDSEGWKLQIAGTGSEKSLNYLKQLCKENGVESSVEFLGFRKDVEKLYQESSIFVLSSRYEGFGLVLIEAMSQGCACVACDYQGRQREIIQDESQGLCCEPDNIDALADSLGKIISDENYRESVRKNAVERSKYYSIDNTMERWMQLLSQLVKK